MAIDLSDEYPGQVDTDAAYPLGKPRNRSAPGSTDGTPLEELWMQDVHGLLQKILDADGATPTGTPDSVTSSQYFTALRRVQSGYTFYILTGAYLVCPGQINISDGGIQQIQDGGELEVKNGGVQNVESGGEIVINDGGEITFQSGAILDAESGSNINLQSGSQLRAYSGSYFQLDGEFEATDGSTTTYADGATVTYEGGDNYPQLSSRSEWVPCGGMFWPAYDSQWTNYDGIGLKTATATAQHAFWRVPVPEHYTISKVQVIWKGPTHPTWPPENRTTFAVHKIGTDGSKTLLASQADTSDQSPYESFHALTIEGFSETFTPGMSLLIDMTSESGTNAEEECIWASSQMYATFTELRTAGA